MNKETGLVEWGRGGGQTEPARLVVCHLAPWTGWGASLYTAVCVQAHRSWEAQTRSCCSFCAGRLCRRQREQMTGRTGLRPLRHFMRQFIGSQYPACFSKKIFSWGAAEAMTPRREDCSVRSTDFREPQGTSGNHPGVGRTDL